MQALGQGHCWHVVYCELRLAGHFGAWSADEAASLGAALRHDLPANRVVDAAVRGRKAAPV